MDASYRGLLMNRLADLIERDAGYLAVSQKQSYVIKSAPWIILWFRILGTFCVVSHAISQVLSGSENG